MAEVLACSYPLLANRVRALRRMRSRGLLAGWDKARLQYTQCAAPEGETHSGTAERGRAEGGRETVDRVSRNKTVNLAAFSADRAEMRVVLVDRLGFEPLPELVLPSVWTVLVPPTSPCRSNLAVCARLPQDRNLPCRPTLARWLYEEP